MTEEDEMLFPSRFFQYVVTKFGDTKIIALSKKAKEACAETSRDFVGLFEWIKICVPSLRKKVQLLKDSAKRREEEIGSGEDMHKRRGRFVKK